MPAVVLLFSAALLLVLDQATKTFVLLALREGQARPFGAIGIRRVTYTAAMGGFFGGRTALAVIWVIELAALVALAGLAPIFGGVVAQVALGGAAGNLVDRLWREGVVDFIDLGFWPVFNLADVAIVAGGVVACAECFFELAA